MFFVVHVPFKEYFLSAVPLQTVNKACMENFIRIQQENKKNTVDHIKTAVLNTGKYLGSFQYSDVDRNRSFKWDV